MESAKLGFRRIKLTALSPRLYFKAQGKPHYQMRKAISKKKKKEENVDTAASPVVYKAHLQMEQVGAQKKCVLFHQQSAVLFFYIKDINSHTDFLCVTFRGKYCLQQLFFS